MYRNPQPRLKISHEPHRRKLPIPGGRDAPVPVRSVAQIDPFGVGTTGRLLFATG